MLYDPNRHAVAEACFSVVPMNPRYKPVRPSSAIMVLIAWTGPWNRAPAAPFWASSMSAVLIRSAGVTAVTLAHTPLIRPARRFRAGVSAPVSGSAKVDLMLSKAMKRTPSLPTLPTIWAEQPLYRDAMPSLR